MRPRKSNLVRADTRKVWAADDVDDLHHEMSEQLELLKAVGKQYTEKLSVPQAPSPVDSSFAYDAQ